MPSKSFNLVLKNKVSPYKRIIEIDSDKSISIRSFLIGSICNSTSISENVLESEDVHSTINCLKTLGVKIIKLKAKTYLIYGKGLGSFYAKKNTRLNFGNSGTLARLILGIISTTPGLELKVKGDKSLNKRNMKNLIELLSEFGATFIPSNKYNFPLKIISSQMPVGIKYNAGVSAQLKSAVILAGLNSYGFTKIQETFRSRDHTERMLFNNNQAIKIQNNKTRLIKVSGRRPLSPININVPGDPSSAAFFVALTLLNKKSKIKIRNVCINSNRIGFYNLLRGQGAKIKFVNKKKICNELRSDIIVESCKVKPIKASKKFYTNATDEYPILFVIAALVKGTSIFEGISDLANKESNRIKEMQNILRQLGVNSVFKKDCLKIYGKGILDAKDKNITVPSLGDHRICMSSFIISVLTGAKTIIKNFDTVNTSSPSFLKIMKSLGIKFEKRK